MKLISMCICLYYLQVLENQVVPITNNQLSFNDVDTTTEELVYRITSPLHPQDGTLQLLDQPGQVTHFTQEDVNQNKLLYKPPDDDIGLYEREVSFYFIRKLILCYLCCHKCHIKINCFITYTRKVTLSFHDRNWQRHL